MEIPFNYLVWSNLKRSSFQPKKLTMQNLFIKQRSSLRQFQGNCSKLNCWQNADIHLAIP